MPLLEVEGITLRFGGILALDDVSLDVGEGEIAGLIGPDGAGKTSLFNVVSRLYRPASGCIRLGGEDLLALPGHRHGRHGGRVQFAETLRQAGKGPTRKSLLAAAAKLDLRNNPFVLPASGSPRAPRIAFQSSRFSSSAGGAAAGCGSASSVKAAGG